MLAPMRTPTQALGALAFLAVIAFAGIKLADGWADWVVFGVFVVTFFGFAFAVYQRQYPTKKRAFTRDPDSHW